MASIKDIANMCGVSVATVSKALNDKDDIGADTKQHIKEVAKEMGYFPQYYARAIRMNKSFNIGVLFFDEAMSGLTHDYFSNILNSFKVTAEGKGYDLTFINNNKRHKRAKTFLEHCRYRGLDGVCIACVDFDNPEVKELLRSDIPLVTIDYQMEGKLSVLSNNAIGMKELVEYIIRMGHKKIAYISGDDTVVTRFRVKSYLNTMKEHGLTVPRGYQITSAYRDLQRAGEYTRQILALDEPPTCIMYPDDFSALGGIGVLQDMGYRIPEDISVAGFDDIFIAGQMQPRLTTVHQDMEQIGKRAAENLVALIEKKKNLSFEPVIVDTTLEQGSSILKLS